LPALHGALDGTGGAVQGTTTHRGPVLPGPKSVPTDAGLSLAALHRVLHEHPERGQIALIDDKRQRRPWGGRMTRSGEFQHHPPRGGAVGGTREMKATSGRMGPKQPYLGRAKTRSPEVVGRPWSPTAPPPRRQLLPSAAPIRANRNRDTSLHTTCITWHRSNEHETVHFMDLYRHPGGGRRLSGDVAGFRAMRNVHRTG
jgi:hypothetical protein